MYDHVTSFQEKHAHHLRHLCRALPRLRLQRTALRNLIHSCLWKNRLKHDQVFRVDFALFAIFPNCCRSGGLTRSLSAVELQPVVTPRTKRIRSLSPQELEAIQKLQSPSEIPHAERKRQWNALYRRLERPCPAGVLAKWEAATTQEAKSFDIY